MYMAWSRTTICMVTHVDKSSVFDHPDAPKWLLAGLPVAYLGATVLVAGVWILGERSKLVAGVWAMGVIGVVVAGLTVAIRRRSPLLWLWSLATLILVAIGAVVVAGMAFES